MLKIKKYLELYHSLDQKLNKKPKFLPKLRNFQNQPFHLVSYEKKGKKCELQTKLNNVEVFNFIKNNFPAHKEIINILLQNLALVQKFNVNYKSSDWV